jgi:FdhD protein
VTLTRRPGPSQRTRVREYDWRPDRDVDPPARRDREDRLTTEEPLEIRCAWPGAAPRRVAVTMRTPGHDFELAAGLLRTEGLLRGRQHLHTVAYCTDDTLLPEQRFNVVTVTLTAAPPHEPAVRYDGPAAATSACGVCGTQSIEDVLGRAQVRVRPELDGGTAIDPEMLRHLPDRLRAAQPVFDATGGLHAAGLFDAHGRLVVAREDVGRHNAVDKVVGSRLLDPAATADPDWDPGDGIVLVVSGRVAFEIAHKAVVAGVRVLAAVGAASSLAVGLADQAGLCLVGFLSRDRFVVHTHPEALAG